LIDSKNSIVYTKYKNLCLFLILILIVFVQTNCVPQSNHAIISETKTAQTFQKGLNYQSMIETLCARLRNRFQSGNKSSDSTQSKFRTIYLTSSSIQQHQLSQLDQMILNDLKLSVEKMGFIVQMPAVIHNPSNPTFSECETRLGMFDQDVRTILSSKSCDSQIDCLLIILNLSYQGKTASEMCHLMLTPELVQKNNTKHHMPLQLGHMKKPFRNLDQSAQYISETMDCLVNKLLLTQVPYRILFAKTQNTPESVIQEMMTRWGLLIGNDRIAQTIIPIDCYGDQFVLRDPKISESIPDDTQLLIAMDSIEVHPGKNRIRANVLSMKDQLPLSINEQKFVSFGNSLPGCHFHLYTYTQSKGNSLTGEGYGKCDSTLPKNLWPYSAKILAERSAKKSLTRKIKNLLRKHYISMDTPYLESKLNDKTEIIMNNAILEWENFDENDCIAEARFMLLASYLPFELLPATDSVSTIETSSLPFPSNRFTAQKGLTKSPAPQSVTEQNASMMQDIAPSAQESLTQATEPQSMTEQNASIIQDLTPSVQERLTQATEPQSVTDQNLSIIQDLAPSVQESLTLATETQSDTEQTDLLIQHLNRSVQEHLKQDMIPQTIIQLFEIVGVITRKECISDPHKGAKGVRCHYQYDLTFMANNKKICLSKGAINGAGANIENADNECVSILLDLLYPFPLDIALAMNKNLALDDLKEMLRSLDKKYFQLLEDIDTILESIKSFQAST